MQYWWRCEINSSVAKLLLVNSDSFGKLAIVILVTNLSVRRTDRNTELRRILYCQIPLANPSSFS